MSRTVLQNAQVTKTADDLQPGDTYLDLAGQPMVIDAARTIDGTVHLLQQDGAARQLPAETPVTVIYDQAIQAGDLQEGDLLYAAPGLAIHATGVTHNGDRVQFQLTDLDTVHKLDVTPETLLELA